MDEMWEISSFSLDQEEHLNKLAGDFIIKSDEEGKSWYNICPIKEKISTYF
jgi:hypothetical protein